MSISSHGIRQQGSVTAKSAIEFGTILPIILLNGPRVGYCRVIKLDPKTDKIAVRLMKGVRFAKPSTKFMIGKLKHDGEEYVVNAQYMTHEYDLILQKEDHMNFIVRLASGGLLIPAMFYFTMQSEGEILMIFPKVMLVFILVILVQELLRSYLRDLTNQKLKDVEI